MRDPSGLAQAILAADSRAAVPLLVEAGFDEPEEACRALDRLSGSIDDLTPLPAELVADILASGWPERALRHLERFVEVTGARATLYGRLAQAPPLRDGLVRILASSAFLTDVLVRNPEHLYWLFEDTPHLVQPLSRTELRHHLEQALAGVDDDWIAALRRFQRRELLRIGAAEILACKDVTQIGRELADLADVTVAAVLERLTGRLRSRYGRPLNERGRPALFTIVGLGKYGGRELNYSSDIDLLFVYDEDGKVAAADGGQGIDNAVFFDRLGEALIQTLTEVSPEGFLYRVDMRLRPEGELGPLTRSLRSHWIYYETRGELWERQMLIKARHAAGSSRLWQRFRDMLVPFVYPAHLTVSPSAEIRRVKERIESTIRQRPDGGNNIKLQPGGIRDIEFVVQCLQLLRGRQTLRSRTGGTLTAIRRLRQVGALAIDEAQALEGAYRFLRRLENLLQIDAGRPAYAVPEDGGRPSVALAACLGLEPRSLSSEVAGHLDAVRAVYDAVFSGHRRPVEEDRVDPRWLLEAPADSEAVLETLGTFGFHDPETAQRLLRQQAQHPMMTSTGRDHLAASLALLLPQLGATPDPDSGLVRFTRIVDAYGAPGAFYGMAVGHPRFLSMLVTICGSSALLAELMQHEPGLLDELVGLDLSGETDALDRRTRADPDLLRRFRNSVLLHIGTDDLLGLTSSEETFHRISDLADGVTTAVFDDCRAALARRFGRPRMGRDADRSAGFVCFAGGKAGGRELDFASDLDVFFIYEGQGVTGRGMDNGDFFSATAREVIQVLGNGLFDIDARLRPEGRSAPVVISLTGYRAYLRTRAATWERLALSRARQIAGEPGLGRRVTAAIEAFVYSGPLTVALVDEIVDMRQRMEPAPESGKGQRIDIKRGAGGIVDAEFIAQILVLHHGARAPELRHTSTRVVLERMVEAGVLGREQGRALLLGYERLRQLQKAMRLSSERPSSRLPVGTQGEALARAAGVGGLGELTGEVTDLMNSTRRHFEAVVHRLRGEIQPPRHESPE